MDSEVAVRGATASAGKSLAIDSESSLIKLGEESFGVGSRTNAGVVIDLLGGEYGARAIQEEGAAAFTVGLDFIEGDGAVSHATKADALVFRAAFKLVGGVDFNEIAAVLEDFESKERIRVAIFSEAPVAPDISCTVEDVGGAIDVFFGYFHPFFGLVGLGQVMDADDGDV